MSWTTHYATTVPYTPGYYRALAPTMLEAALESRGLRAPDLQRPLNYCELGMGYGVSLLAHAACFPHMQFWGNDANAVQAQYARELARDAGLANVTVMDDTIEALLDRELPTMDFIVLHGVYTWVSASCQQAIVRFIRKHLALGGVVYVSYNTLPGWAPLMPLRELLRQHGWRMSPQAASPAQRAAGALDFADRIAETGAAYLDTQPQLVELLARLHTAPAAYMAHEYFNPEWQPRHFHEVASALGEAGLGYACPAHLDQHVEAALLSAAQRRELEALQDLVMKEALRDVYVNQKLRRDLYTRGAAALLPAERTARLMARRWQLVDARAGITLTRPAPRLQEVPDAAQCHAVLDALSAGPASLQELLARPTLAGMGGRGLLQALQLLSGHGHVQPALAPALARAARAGAQRFNAVVLERGGGDGLQHLACPETGQAIGWTAGGMAQIRLARSGVDGPQAMAGALQAWRREHLAPGEPATELDDLVHQSRRFLDDELPVLRQLGMA